MSAKWAPGRKGVDRPSRSASGRFVMCRHRFTSVRTT